MRQAIGILRVALVVLVVVSMITVADDDPDRYQNDAGSGIDAGNAQSLALPVAIQTSYGATAAPLDIDWFSAASVTSSPSCSLATLSASKPIYADVGALSGGSTTLAVMSVAAGATQIGGLAISPTDATLLRVSPQPWAGSQKAASYTFTLDQVGIAPLALGDALSGGDAGDSASNALAVAAGCISGHLGSNILDNADVYAISVPDGQSITYSLASSSPALSLSLADASGSIVGPLLSPGQSATAAPAAGTYYLSASRTAGIGDQGYLVGLTLGPGPGCRPYCLD